jgi:hypothetical protein
MHTGVVCLSERSEKTGSRRSADQPSVLLFPEVGPCGMCALVCSVDMDAVDQIPVRLFHVLEADISQDTGVVDEDINTSECVDGRLDDGLSVLDRIVVGDGLAASGADLIDDLVCSLSWSQQRSNN